MGKKYAKRIPMKAKYSTMAASGSEDTPQRRKALKDVSKSYSAPQGSKQEARRQLRALKVLDKRRAKTSAQRGKKPASRPKTVRTSRDY